MYVSKYSMSEMEVSGASIIQVVEVNGSCHILKVSFVNILLI